MLRVIGGAFAFIGQMGRPRHERKTDRIDGWKTPRLSLMSEVSATAGGGAARQANVRNT
jgi:hypothetical protein